MSSNALGSHQVVAYVFFCQTGHPRNYDYRSVSYRVPGIELCTSRSMTCLIPKCAELHVLHGGVISIDIWMYAISRQMFRGGGLLFGLCLYSSGYINVLPFWNKLYQSMVIIEARPVAATNSFVNLIGTHRGGGGVLNSLFNKKYRYQFGIQ